MNNNLIYINKTQFFGIASLLPELIKNKIYLGINKTFCHPKASGFLKGFRGKTYLFDLFQVGQSLQNALRVINSTYATHYVFTKLNKLKVKFTKKILFVGFPGSKRKALKDLYFSKNQFYVSDKDWVNGLLTNNFSLFEYKRNFLKNIELKSDIEKQLFYQNFGGILKLSTLPDLVVIYNHSQSTLIFSEAERMNIPVVSFLNASDNPAEVDYPILGNFNSVKGGNFFYRLIKAILKEANIRF
jgi:ribosomal protein S2